MATKKGTEPQDIVASEKTAKATAKKPVKKPAEAKAENQVVEEATQEKAPDDTWRKIGYMERVANDASAGKDTRIYHMAGRLLKIGEDADDTYYRFLNGRGIREFVVVGGVGGVGVPQSRDDVAFARRFAAWRLQHHGAVHSRG